VKLHVQEWGEGTRTAVLVHGATDDHTTWHRVAPHLAAQGFRVLAPDLRGHGLSPRCDSYRLADFAADLVDSVPAGAEVLLGHSLGALAVGLAAGALAPRSLVYLDPPWRLRPLDGDPALPSWSEEDVAVDLASLAKTDPVLGEWVPARVMHELPDAIPTHLLAPTLVIEPLAQPLTDRAIRARLLERGYRFESLAHARHVMHRDDLEAFLAVVHNWTCGGAL
jgi:pimeloyl-ACP methyl ester carboxylesterase